MPPAIAPIAPIALPDLTIELKARVQYPAVPHIPPTATDVADSVVLCNDVFNAFSQSHPSLRDGNSDAFYRGEKGKC